MKDTDGSLLSLAFSTIICYSAGVVFLLLAVAEKKGSERQQELGNGGGVFQSLMALVLVKDRQ
jgi:hypothetical protein